MGGAFLYESDGPLCALRQSAPLEQSPQQDAGKEIPGAGEVGGLLMGLGEGDPPVRPVVAGRAHLSGGEAHPG